MNAKRREYSGIRFVGSATVPVAVVGVSPNTSPFFPFQPERGARRREEKAVFDRMNRMNRIRKWQKENF
jgi:hypothetical protein